MSRPIKFRAWDKEESKWANSGNLQLEIGGLSGLYWQFGSSTEPVGMVGTRYKLMQFTGLLDKNGAEIYEGDIVERQGGRRGKIIYYAGGFLWEEKSTELTPLAEFGFGAGMNYTVIGNIYESPKLCGW